VSSPSGVREQVAELSHALADAVGPVDSGRADPAAGPEVLLPFASAKAHLCNKLKIHVLYLCKACLKEIWCRQIRRMRRTFIPAANSEVKSWRITTALLASQFAVSFGHIFQRILPKFSQIKKPVPLSVDSLQSLREWHGSLCYTQSSRKKKRLPNRPLKSF
jgi:hypothetical protein